MAIRCFLSPPISLTPVRHASLLSYTRTHSTSLSLLPSSFVRRHNRFFGPLKASPPPSLKPKPDHELPKPDPYTARDMGNSFYGKPDRKQPNPALPRGQPIPNEWAGHLVAGSGGKKLYLPKGTKYNPKFKHFKHWRESFSDWAIGKVEPGDDVLDKWFLATSLFVYRAGTFLILAAATKFVGQFVDKRCFVPPKTSEEWVVSEEKEEVESVAAVEIIRLEKKMDETGKFSWVPTGYSRRKKKND